MPVELDRLPPMASYPEAPRLWLWLGLLPLWLLVGLGVAVWLDEPAWYVEPIPLRSLAIGLALLAWCMMMFVRGSLYLRKYNVAHGWNDAREDHRCGLIRRGRRSFQVLATSAHTALRTSPKSCAFAQLNVLQGNAKAIQSQAFRNSVEIGRHSQLPIPTHGIEALQTAFTQVLADLSPALQALPTTTPLALLLDVDSAYPATEVQLAWQQAWQHAGFPQTLTAVPGSGLAAVDDWLDQRIREQTLLLVVAVQLAPAQPDNTGEVAAGLLLGNRLTQQQLQPQAYLHRPEPAPGMAAAPLLKAARQSLEWGPVPASEVDYVWLVGLNAIHQGVVDTALKELAIAVKPGVGLWSLDAVLGHPGRAGTWLAIALATQSIESGCRAQMVISGSGVGKPGLWSTLVSPVETAMRQQEVAHA
jgi:hypothetical protein